MNPNNPPSGDEMHLFGYMPSTGRANCICGWSGPADDRIAAREAYNVHTARLRGGFPALGDPTACRNCLATRWEYDRDPCTRAICPMRPAPSSPVAVPPAEPECCCEYADNGVGRQKVYDFEDCARCHPLPVASRWPVWTVLRCVDRTVLQQVAPGRWQIIGADGWLDDNAVSKIVDAVELVPSSHTDGTAAPCREFMVIAPAFSGALEIRCGNCGTCEELPGEMALDELDAYLEAHDAR